MAKDDEINLDTDTSKTAPAGLKWLYEFEALNSPSLLNNLYGNVYSFPHVIDAEILIDRHNHKMLIYIEFSWIVRKIAKNRKKIIVEALLDNLQELLPSFAFRIIEDKALFDIAVDRLKKSLQGELNEEKPKDSAIAVPIAADFPTSNSNGGEISKENPATNSTKD